MSGALDLDTAGERWTPPAAWRLAPQEALGLRLLVANERVRGSDFLDALDAQSEAAHGPEYARVIFSKARAKLAPFGVVIFSSSAKQHHGYWLSPETRAALIAGAERIEPPASEGARGR